jgi:hypothetical protein
LKGGAKHILLFGGSLPGKTTVLVMAVIYRALRFAGRRHLGCRYQAKDTRSPALRETLLPCLANTIGKNGFTCLAHESMVILFNGSEIWIGGLGDRKQADKILGREYNTDYFNEISQLGYTAVTMAYSRPAMRAPGRRNLFMYDRNPGSPPHWAYKIFVFKKTFLTGEPGDTGVSLEKTELYQSVMLNPEDNKDNLPEEFDRYAAGQDFGLNTTIVKIVWLGDVVYVFRDYGAFNMTTRSFNHNRNKTVDNRPEKDGAAGQNLPVYDNFSILNTVPLSGDSYLINARVNIAVSVLIRNIARAGFVIKRTGNDVKAGPLYNLFRRPDAGLSRYGLWKETAAWRHPEGEACDRRPPGWFGPDYAGGIPKKIYILDPRRIKNGAEGLCGSKAVFSCRQPRWFYQSDTELIPIFSDGLVRFRDWNPVRGVNPLSVLAPEPEQDYAD